MVFESEEKCLTSLVSENRKNTLRTFTSTERKVKKGEGGMNENVFVVGIEKKSI